MLFMEGKTKLGLAQNVEALLAYALWFVSGFVLLIIEKENKFVRFHAMQSFVTFLLLAVVGWVAGLVPFLGGIINYVLGFVQLALWILLMYKAYKGETYKLPVIGEIVDKQINQ
jgi:uncharacterized membrane protein